MKLGVGAKGDESKAKYQQTMVLGLDDATFVGAPRFMVAGNLADLRQPDTVIIDQNGYEYLWPGEPIVLGRELEMNDHRAVIVGVCKASDTFQTFPIFYTRYNNAVQYIPQARKVMSGILVGTEPGVSKEEVCRGIEARTKPSANVPGLKALTRQQFIDATLMYFVKRTGIVVNFSITVALGFIVGCAIAGQTFYSFTLENLNQFGSLKAMGVSNLRIAGMVLFPGLLVGAPGY